MSATARALPQPGSARAWVLAARPQTLTAAFVPVAVGTAVAHVRGGVAWGPALAALFGAFMLQIVANFANDLFDHEKGADDETRLGPVRAAQAGLLTHAQLRAGMAVTIGLGLLAGGYLVAVAGWPIVAIGVASILSAIAYTGGPFPLGYHGLGDIFVMLFFGFVAVVGTVFVQGHGAPALAWWASVPVGALATAILVVNNVRDAPTDVKVGKRTLVVRFGRGAGVAEYVLLMVAAFGVAGWHALTVHWAVAAPLLTAPWAIVLTLRLIHRRGEALNPVLASTAKLLFVFGSLYALGLALGA